MLPRCNCYSRSHSLLYPTKPKGLCRLKDDARRRSSIFLEEPPIFWIPASPSVSLKKRGTSRHNTVGDIAAELKSISRISAKCVTWAAPNSLPKT